MNDFYVYVYIDPRNYEDFYFGMGQGKRKDAHLADTSDTEKLRRIEAIGKAGLKPIVRVLARDLTKDEAFLVEKTLLWKLGKQLTNISTGYYADKFRPQNTLHTELTGFDYRRGIYYYNVGEGDHRKWEDYVRFGFISAGQGPRWRDAMLNFHEGDVVAAYLKKHGFVGIGQLTSSATRIKEALVDGKPLLSQKLLWHGMSKNADSLELSEYVASVRWLKTLDPTDAKWVAKSKIFTTTHVRASLDGQPRTIEFLEREFGIDIRELVR